MTMAADPLIPPPPQTGRTIPERTREEPTGLWSQLLTAFRDLSGAFDPFANDANPDIRALGRAARARRVPQVNDYFGIGDLCARLTLQGNALSQTYAAKTIAAYSKAGEVSSKEVTTARRAMLAFAFWSADAARTLGTHESLQAALLVCERVRQLINGAPVNDDDKRLAIVEENLRDQLTHLFEGDQSTLTDDRAGSRLP